MYERKILLAFIRIHILYHAATEPGIYGVGMMQELQRHGYTISPGTLYPILHDMTNHKLLSVTNKTVNGKVRKLYTITKDGIELLAQLRRYVIELSQEVIG
jgi:DNA-binding PadR family transcriptional regulator